MQGIKLAVFRCEARLIRRRLCGAQRRHRSQVRILSAVPRRRKLCIACDGIFMLCIKNLSRAHCAAIFSPVRPEGKRRKRHSSPSPRISIVGREVLKVGGTFLICNEANGDTDKDERWTEIIGGMTIYKDTELKANICRRPGRLSKMPGNASGYRNTDFSRSIPYIPIPLT